MTLIPSEIKILGESILSNPEVSDTVSFLLSPELQEKLFLLKIISFFVCFFLLIFIVYLLRNSSYRNWHYGDDMKEFLSFKPDDFKLTKEYCVSYWRNLIKKLESGSESEYKVAVVYADYLLDYVLKEKGYEGKSLDERLRQIAPTKISNLDALWDAHRICDKIFHEPLYKLDLTETKKILAVYKKAFQDLGVF